MSGTFKTIGAAHVKCAAVRCVTLLTRGNHPRVGQNLLMTGADLLGGCTCTPAVSQRSESGQGIIGAKAGKGMLLLYSGGLDGTHVTGRRVNVPCLAITAIVVASKSCKRREQQFGKQLSSRHLSTISHEL